MRFNNIFALVFGLILTAGAAQAQINTVNGASFGNSSLQFRDEAEMVSASGAYLRQFADFSARGGGSLTMFSPDSSLVFTARGVNGWLWGSTLGNEKAVLPHGDLISFASFSLEGDFIVTAGGQNAKIWTCPKGAFLALLPHSERIAKISVSPNGRYLATAGSTILRVWDITQRVNIFQQSLPMAPISIMFNRTGDLMLAIIDGTVALRRIPNGSEVGVISPGSPVRTAFFSPDGKYIMVGTDSMGHLWDAYGFRKVADVQFGPEYR